MALALCHVNIVCRSKGQSAVAGSAYRSGKWARAKIQKSEVPLMHHHSMLREHGGKSPLTLKKAGREKRRAISQSACFSLSRKNFFTY